MVIMDTIDIVRNWLSLAIDRRRLWFSVLVHRAKKFPSTKFFWSKPTALYPQNLFHASASGPIFLLPNVALDMSSNRI